MQDFLNFEFADSPAAGSGIVAVIAAVPGIKNLSFPFKSFRLLLASGAPSFLLLPEIKPSPGGDGTNTGPVAGGGGGLGTSVAPDPDELRTTAGLNSELAGMQQMLAGHVQGTPVKLPKNCPF